MEKLGVVAGNETHKAIRSANDSQNKGDTDRGNSELKSASIVETHPGKYAYKNIKSRNGAKGEIHGMLPSSEYVRDYGGQCPQGPIH